LEGHVLYFCDESSQINDAYMAIGGMALHVKRLPEILAGIRAINAECGVISEVKWSTAKKRRVSVHERYIDYFFDLLDAGKIHFHIRFAPFGEYCHSESGNRGRVDTVSKMYYQMIVHRPIAFYGRLLPIHVHPDHGECTSYLPKIRGAMCAEGYRTKGSKPNCVPVLEPRDSKHEPFLQLLDVPLGALAALKNQRDIGEVKTALAARVLTRTGWDDLEGNSRSVDRRLNIWNVAPKG